MTTAIIVLSICLGATLILALDAHRRAMRAELLALQLAKTLRDAAASAPDYIIRARAEDIQRVMQMLTAEFQRTGKPH